MALTQLLIALLASSCLAMPEDGTALVQQRMHLGFNPHDIVEDEDQEQEGYASRHLAKAATALKKLKWGQVMSTRMNTSNYQEILQKLAWVASDKNFLSTLSQTAHNMSEYAKGMNNFSLLLADHVSDVYETSVEKARDEGGDEAWKDEAWQQQHYEKIYNSTVDALEDYVRYYHESVLNYTQTLLLYVRDLKESLPDGETHTLALFSAVEALMTPVKPLILPPVQDWTSRKEFCSLASPIFQQAKDTLDKGPEMSKSESIVGKDFSVQWARVMKGIEVSSDLRGPAFLGVNAAVEAAYDIYSAWYNRIQLTVEPVGRIAKKIGCE